jgi:hypothetical protein
LRSFGGVEGNVPEVIVVTSIDPCRHRDKLLIQGESIIACRFCMEQLGPQVQPEAGLSGSSALLCFPRPPNT